MTLYSLSPNIIDDIIIQNLMALLLCNVDQNY